MLDTSNIGLMSFAVAVAIMTAGVVGYLLAKRWWKSDPDDAPFGVLQASAFGMVGLLLGFSSRWQSRDSTSAARSPCARRTRSVPRLCASICFGRLSPARCVSSFGNTYSQESNSLQPE